MITIHIDPTENPVSEGDQVVEQTQRNRNWLTSTIWGIVLILAIIVIYLMTACSGSQTPAAYQYQVPETQLTATPTANQPLQNVLEETSTMVPALTTEISIPLAVTKPPLPPLSGRSDGVIAFQTDRDRQDEIYLMNADGSNQRLLISNQWALDSMPAWSPDGDRIAFASRDRGKDFEICLVFITHDLLGIQGDILKLTENDFDDLHPTWSPDGRQISFYSQRGNYNDIYVVDVDGTGEHPLTETQSNDKDPAWSPDGTLIAFVTNRDKDNEIYVMKPDGSEQRALTDNDSNEWSPAWSPDGSQIAFVSDRNGTQDLYVMDADGSNARRLTDEKYPWNDDPAWSSDGKLIAFRSNRNDQVDIYIIKADGSSIPQQLTHNSEIDQDRAPAWRPDTPNLSDGDDK